MVIVIGASVTLILAVAGGGTNDALALARQEA